jgi:hypothetical protein
VADINLMMMRYRHSYLTTEVDLEICGTFSRSDKQTDENLKVNLAIIEVHKT